MIWGTATLTNALVVDNSATSGGGGLCVGGTATLRNATLVANEAGWGGGLQVSNEGTATLYNSVLATNASAENSNDVLDNGTLAAYNTLSSYNAWDGGANNYVYDASQPLFKDAANGDYTLAQNSQALNKGNNAYAVDAEGNALTTDLAGNPRFVGSSVDLGAYERQVDKSIPTLTVETRGVSGLTLTLGYVSGAASYPVEYSTDPNFEIDVMTRVFSSNGVKKLSNLTPNTTYYVRVKAGENGTWSEAGSATTFPIRCATPTLEIAQRDIKAQSHTVTIGFSSGASSYTMEYSADPTFTTYETKVYTSNGPKKFADFPTDSTVYVRVKAEGEGIFSDSSYSDAVLVLGKPTFTLAQRGTDGTALTLMLDYVSGATKYVVDYSTDATFATYSTREFTSNGSKKLNGLQAGTTYFVRVTACGADGNVASFVSATQSQAMCYNFHTSIYI